MKVNVYFKKDTLRGQDSNEIRVELKEIVKDKYEDDEMWDDLKTATASNKQIDNMLYALYKLIRVIINVNLTNTAHFIFC